MLELAMHAPFATSPIVLVSLYPGRLLLSFPGLFDSLIAANVIVCIPSAVGGSQSSYHILRAKSDGYPGQGMSVCYNRASHTVQ